MAQRFLRPRMLISAVLAAAAPSLLVLLALVVLGEVRPKAALLAGAAVVALLWWPVRRHLHALAGLADWLEALAKDGAGARLRLSSPLLPRRIAAAIGNAVNDWRRRLDDLLQRQASSDSVIAHLPDPVIAINRELRVVRASAGASAVGGGNAAGYDLATVLRDPEVLAAAERVIRTGTPEEIDFVGGIGAETARAARIVSLPAPAPDGTAALIAVSDVTGARRIEQTRADFVANASHELRTPLSVLTSCIQTMLGPAAGDAPARERFLAMMDQQAWRMTRLVGDLLSLSRIELNEHKPPSDTVPLAAVVGHVADSLEFAARARGNTIEIESALADPMVVGDRDELTQLFQNLIDNAIKYGRPGTAIRIAIAPGRVKAADAPDGSAEAVAVTVRDQGAGIAREHLLRLTERFYRVDAARSREMGGTGLGLAIVKHIVNRHRGDFGIDSEVGIGSAFTVTLPAAVTAAAASEARAGPEAATVTKP